jgi:hypothetical protein
VARNSSAENSEEKEGFLEITCLKRTEMKKIQFPALDSGNPRRSRESHLFGDKANQGA